MPCDREFERYLRELIHFAYAANLALRASEARATMDSVTYTYAAQAEASASYQQSEDVRAARNAVVAGCVALGTMWTAGAVMKNSRRGAGHRLRGRCCNRGRCHCR